MTTIAKFYASLALLLLPLFSCGPAMYDDTGDNRIHLRFPDGCFIESGPYFNVSIDGEYLSGDSFPMTFRTDDSEHRLRITSKMLSERIHSLTRVIQFSSDDTIEIPCRTWFGGCE